MNKQKTLILIDGHALAFRQYYALERTNMQTSDNVQTWAVFGFFKAIFDLLNNQKIKPDAIAVAFDVSRRTFRTEKFEDYKAQREKMPDSLHSQLGYICEGLKAFNIPIYTKEGYEADDVIGTITREATELGHKTYILTGDQDAFQLIDKEATVQVLIPYGGKLIPYDWNKVYEKWGVYPDQVVDYKALRGDTSDNIPGIKGIGEKTAQSLLTKYKNLDEILEDCDNMPPNSVQKKICEGRESAILSRELATIVRDVDINFDFDKTSLEMPNVDNVLGFLRKYQLNSFLKNIDNILGIFNKDDSFEMPDFTKSEQKNLAQPQQMQLIEGTPNSNGQLQLGLFSEVIKEKVNKETLNFEKTLLEGDLTEFIENLKKQKKIAIDVVANVKNAVESEIVGFAFAFKEDEIKTFYLPYSENNLQSLKPVFEDENIKKITFNGKNDINTLKVKKIILNGIRSDITLASYIKNPANKHEVETQALNYLNYMMEDLPESVNVKKGVLDFSKASVNELFRYTTDRIFAVYDLSEYWEKNLDEKELKLLHEIETPLLYVLAQMEFDGISIDRDYLKKLSNEMDLILKDLEEKIFQIAGEPFNVSSPKQVGEILFNKLGLKVKGKKKGSTGADVLEALAEDNEICQFLIEHRKFAKLKTTYTDSLPLLISPKDNRIHTSYNQAITTTGRLSSSNPNLQNIPIRTPEGNKLRLAFVPKNRENSLILSADYSQIELRLLAHVSGEEHLIEAFNSGQDIHSLTAAKVFGVPVEKVTKEMRYKSKAVNFGIIYGQTKYGLAKGLGIQPAEAELFIQKYFETYPKVKEYMDKTIEFAEKHGFVETIFGRKRYVQNELTSPNHMIQEFGKRAAINQPLQGTAADLIKMAMVEAYKKLKENNLKSKMVMQVHDELVVEVLENEFEQVKKIIVDAMELKQPLKVPLLVDVSWGKTWQE